MQHYNLVEKLFEIIEVMSGYHIIHMCAEFLQQQCQ